MTIRLNGEPYEVPGELTVRQLLERLAIDPRIVAVEHNLTIVKRHRQDEVMVREGDEVEIVRFVGGGLCAFCVAPFALCLLPFDFPLVGL